jgi:hypothetical protein
MRSGTAPPNSPLGLGPQRCRILCAPISHGPLDLLRTFVRGNSFGLGVARVGGLRPWLPAHANCVGQRTRNRRNVSWRYKGFGEIGAKRLSWGSGCADAAAARPAPLGKGGGVAPTRWHLRRAPPLVQARALRLDRECAEREFDSA